MALLDDLKMELNEIDEPLLSDEYISYLITKHDGDFISIMYEAAMRKHLKLKEIQVDGVNVNRDSAAYEKLAMEYSPRITGTVKNNEYPV